MKEKEFDVRLNKDVYYKGVKNVDKDGKKLKKKRKIVKDDEELMIKVKIKEFVRECLDKYDDKMDGEKIYEEMKKRGINIRYMGKIEG
jgi:hypothetical protein